MAAGTLGSFLKWETPVGFKRSFVWAREFRMKQPGDGSGCSRWDSGAKHSLHKAAGPPCLPCASGQHAMALSRHSSLSAARPDSVAFSRSPVRQPGSWPFLVAACEALYLASARNRLWNVTPGDISSQFSIWIDDLDGFAQCRSHPANT